MALCPQCDHSILVHTLLTDDLAGLQLRQVPWHPGEPGRVSGVARKTGQDALAGDAGRRRPTRASDSGGAKKCPKCRSLMSKYRIRSRQDQPARLLPALRGDLARRRRMGAGRGTGGFGRVHPSVHPGMAVRGRLESPPRWRRAPAKPVRWRLCALRGILRVAAGAAGEQEILAQTRTAKITVTRGAPAKTTARGSQCTTNRPYSAATPTVSTVPELNPR